MRAKMFVDSVWVWSNFILIFSLVLGVAASCAISITSRVKDRESTLEIARLTSENLKLASLLQPRRLTGEVGAKLLEVLSSNNGHEIIVASVMSDAEARDFSEDLAAILRRSNWKVLTITPLWLGKARGIQIGTSEGVSLPGAAVLEDAFASAGIKYSINNITKNDQGQIPGDFNPSAIYLLIGTKP